MTNSNKIKMLVKYPGMPIQEEEHTNSLKVLQMLVGGNIEYVPIDNTCGIIVNEEGLINDMRYNFNLHGNMIFGPALFVGVNGEEFADWRDPGLAWETWHMLRAGNSLDCAYVITEQQQQNLNDKLPPINLTKIQRVAICPRCNNETYRQSSMRCRLCGQMIEWEGAEDNDNKGTSETI